MKDYLSQYLTSRTRNSATNTKGDDLTELTKPDLTSELEGSVSFVSSQPLEYQEIDAEVAWRIQAMLPQIPDNGPIPFLVARQAVETTATQCLSCGDVLEADARTRCSLCCRAANLALELAMARGEAGT